MLLRTVTLTTYVKVKVIRGGSPKLNNYPISIPRLIIDNSNTSQIYLHGFCDASEQAYGACVYVVCKNLNRKDNAFLICSKSRVAPLKALPLPRLELCGAVLLVKLTNKVVTGLRVDVQGKYYWTDSKIVLAWIGSPAKR